jgi:hypothetical protein
MILKLWSNRRPSPVARRPSPIAEIVFSLLALSVLFPSFVGYANAPPCKVWDQDLIYEDQRRVRINWNSFDLLTQAGSELTPLDARDGILVSMLKWNDQTNSARFRYLGTSTHPLAPSFFSSFCNNWNYDYQVLIHIVDSDVPGGASRRCGERYVEVRLSRGNTAQWDWLLHQAGVPIAKRDFLHVVGHELGHTLGLDHPDSTSTGSVMGPLQTLAMTDRHNLFPWDNECLYQLHGPRKLEIREWSMQNGTWSFSDFLIAGHSANFSRAVPNMKPSATFPPVSSINVKNHRAHFNSNPTAALNVVNSIHYGVRPDNNSVQRIYFGDNLFGYGWNHVSRIRHVQSSSEFNGHVGVKQSAVSFCPPESCSGTTDPDGIFVESMFPPSIAYRGSLMLRFWQHQNRERFDHNRLYYDIRHSADSESLGARRFDIVQRNGVFLTSRFGPQVACQSSYCLLGWVDEESLFVNLVPFAVNSSGNSVTFLWGSVTTLSYKAYNSFALWHSNNRWWIAMQRPFESDLQVRVWNVSASSLPLPSNWGSWEVMGRSYTSPAIVSSRDADITQVFLGR